MARNLPVCIRRVPLDICHQSYEATRRGEKNCCGSQAPIYIRGSRSCKVTHQMEKDGRCSQAHIYIRGHRSCKYTHQREDGGRGSQPRSFNPMGTARHPLPHITLSGTGLGCCHWMGSGQEPDCT